MKTAIEELKIDLIESIELCNNALNDIDNEQIKNACKSVVSLTIDNVLNRIDNELLYLEKGQIMQAYNDGKASVLNPELNMSLEGYYKSKYN